MKTTRAFIDLNKNQVSFVTNFAGNNPNRIEDTFVFGFGAGFVWNTQNDFIDYAKTRASEVVFCEL